MAVRVTMGLASIAVDALGVHLIIFATSSMIGK